MTPNTPAGGAVDPERLAQLETQVCDARNAWSQHFEARYLHNDDVPDLDHFIALWVAERMPATVSADAVLALVEADRALDAVLERDRLRREAGSMLRFTEEIEIARTVRNAALDELEALTRGEK